MEKEWILPLVAQLIGVCGMASLFAMYQQTDRRKLVRYKLITDVLWVFHYCCLGAWAGAIPNFVGIFRELVFVNKEKKWARCFLWPIFFILANWALAALSWKSALSLLPIGASTFVTLALWADRPKVTRLICLPVSVCFMIYDVFVGSWVGIINESIGIFSIVTALLKKDRKQED